MADEHDELRHVNWAELFGFTQIFKSFRIAIHPSKMLLALAAIVIVLVAGWAMDLLWRAGGQYARVNEVTSYAIRSPATFRTWKDNWIAGQVNQSAALQAEAEEQRHTLKNYKTRMGYASKHLTEAFEEELLQYNKAQEADYKRPDIGKIIRDAEQSDTGFSQLLSSAEGVFNEEVEKIEKILEESLELAAEKIDQDKTLKTDDDKEKAEDQFDKHRQAAQRALAARKLEFAQNVVAIQGKGVFTSLLKYEWDCARKAITAAESGQITAGLTEYQNILHKKAIPPVADYQPFRPATSGTGGSGVLFWMLMGYQGIAWAFSEHWVFAVLFALGTLAVWALFGGAIHRIAALHATRDEKISIRQALEFSVGKFLSFFTAPLIPVAIILVIGLLIATGGIVLNLWGLGTVIVGVLFFLPILAGLGIAFLLVGLVAGGGLMYPTIAVEGSDSFDAISRSFSYVFARPFRAMLYGLVALLYGVITYVFVRLFVYLALGSTHLFLKWFVWAGGQTLSPEADKVDVLWTAPQFQALFGPFSWAAMTNTEKVGAFLIGVWVFLLAASVAAYLLSFIASSTTSIYLLLRRKVDATDLDDVYVEEASEEFEQPAPPAESEGKGLEEAPKTEGATEETEEKKPKQKKKKSTSDDD